MVQVMSTLTRGFLCYALIRTVTQCACLRWVGKFICFNNSTFYVSGYDFEQGDSFIFSFIPLEGHCCAVAQVC